MGSSNFRVGRSLAWPVVVVLACASGDAAVAPSAVGGRLRRALRRRHRHGPAPHLTLHLRRQPVRLEGAAQDAEVGPPGRQPLHGLQLGDQRLERRLGLQPPERRPPRRRRQGRRGRARARRGRAAGRRRDGGDRADRGLRRRGQAEGRRRQPDARFPPPPLPRVPATQGRFLPVPAGHGRRRRLPGRVRGLARERFPGGEARRRARDLLLARQRARPVDADPSADPAQRQGHVRRDPRAHDRLRLRHQAGGAAGPGLRSRELRLDRLRLAAGRHGPQGPGFPRLLPGLAAPGRGARRTQAGRRARPALVPRGARRRRSRDRAERLGGGRGRAHPGAALALGSRPTSRRAGSPRTPAPAPSA